MVEKYIIMCGGVYKKWETPRQLSVVNNEMLVERTIRLLRENGIKDINISSNNPIFEQFGVPVLSHNNYYIANGINDVKGDWYNAFYPTDEPVCYIFGDVYFSDEAIKTIVETKTDDIEFFGSRPPFADNYIKSYGEPFALKVVNTNHLKESIERTRELDRQHKFNRKPIMWELWAVINNVPIEKDINEFSADYVVINDYTCDIDSKRDIMKLNKVLGGIKMVKCEVIEPFTLERFNELENITRKGYNKEGFLFVGDTFDCDSELADYLMGNNEKGKIVVKIIEVKPVKEEKKTIEYTTTESSATTETKVEMPKMKSTKKKKASKK